MMGHTGPITEEPAIVSLVVLLFVFLITFYLVCDSLTRVGGWKNSDGREEGSMLYEDEDGVATEKSQKEHAVAVPRYVVLGSVQVGLLCAFGLSVDASLVSYWGSVVEYWMLVGSWVRHSLLCR